MPESTSAHEAGKPLPVVPFLKIPDDGEPYLEGHRCKQCKAVFLGERSVCASCGARGALEPTRLADTGKLYVYTIVHRSFPGIEVPYVSAVVDLDGGGTVKGNLIGVDADPTKIEFGMPVEVVYDDALGRKDKAGNHYLSYFFKPRGSALGGS